MNLYIFNPENDMALSDGTPGYTPPARIQQMRRELWWLPQWWAGEDDLVWNGTDRLELPPGTRIEPWGWSPMLRHQLLKAGVEESLLPSPERIEHIRQLSHRRTAVELLAELREELSLDGHLCGSSVLCHDREELETALAEYGEAVVKQPWSSSGRGIRFIAPSPKPLPQGGGENHSESLPPWGEVWRGAGGRTGNSCLIVEQRLHKVADFALEFWLDGQGGVTYRGLSLFNTDERGAYLAGWVAPEGQKLAWLTQYVPLPYLQEIRHWWTERLSRFDYEGPVGIDMMLAHEGICPCIEVNWRWTMGLVSCLVAEQGRYGRMVVEYIYGHFSAEVEAFS